MGMVANTVSFVTAIVSYFLSCASSSFACFSSRICLSRAIFSADSSFSSTKAANIGSIAPAAEAASCGEDARRGIYGRLLDDADGGVKAAALRSIGSFRFDGLAEG